MKIWSFAKHAFMVFWYPYVKTLNLILPSIVVQGKRLVVFPDVYKPLENEYACADYCRVGDRVLGLGCGSGVGASGAYLALCEAGFTNVAVYDGSWMEWSHDKLPTVPKTS